MGRRERWEGWYGYDKDDEDKKDDKDEKYYEDEKDKKDEKNLNFKLAINMLMAQSILIGGIKLQLFSVVFCWMTII